ncbi:nuclear transport factor 2 family protein [Streptomyces sp. MB22_4]|uniref:nuclear transport factor 2 family protein n=1 Tax=Streptomyces sp. MB22_4 TaxID=3383120 RepID=UPI00399F528F
MDAAAGTTAAPNLVARYAELVDVGDFAGVGALFAGGVFVGSGAPAEGSEAAERMLRDTVILCEDGTPRTRHAVTNLAVEVDEGAGTAAARSRVTVFQALPELPLQPIAAGRDEDRFERRGERWEFAERRVRIHLVGDVSRRLRA